MVAAPTIQQKLPIVWEDFSFRPEISRIGPIEPIQQAPLELDIPAASKAIGALSSVSAPERQIILEPVENCK